MTASLLCVFVEGGGAAAAPLPKVCSPSHPHALLVHPPPPPYPSLQAIAGIVMMLISAGLFWFWMPHDTSGSGASYAFTEVGVKSSAGFTEFGASGSAEPTAPAAAVGGYQGFGSEAAL